MYIWLRWIGLLAVIAGATVFGWFSILASDEPPVSEIAQGRWKELFWLAVFAFVMTTSVWVFLRRQAERLQRAVWRVRK